MFGYIYKTTDLKNGKIYIGQHKSTTFVGESYIGSGVIIQKIRQSCINQGISIKERLCTELIEECSTAEQLNEREIYWISFYNSTDPRIGYNLHIGGMNTIGTKNGMFDKNQSDKSKKLNSDWHKDRMWFTNGTQDVFVTQKESLAYIENGFYRGRSRGSLKGKQRSVEASRKTSESLKGRHKTDEQRKKLSESRSSKVWITDGVVTKSVNVSDAEQFLSCGYRLGRTFKANPWNRGKTAEDTPLLREIGQKTRGTRKALNNYVPWNKKKQ